MAENLTIRLTDKRVEWLILDEESGIVRLRGEGKFAEFADLIKDVTWQGETRILIGGEQVLLTSALVPSRQQRQILQAVPYAVEEELAVDADGALVVGRGEPPSAQRPVRPSDRRDPGRTGAQRCR